MSNRVSKWSLHAALLGIAVLGTAWAAGGVQASPLAGDDEAVPVPGRRGAAPADEPMTESEQVLAAASTARLIDNAVIEVLEEEGIRPGDASSDTEFLRRVSLDIAGVPPTEREVREFLASKDPDKRQVKIEELLHTDYFADHMADRFKKLIIGSGQQRRYGGSEAFQDWLAGYFRENRGLDALVTDVITATGATSENPATAFTMKFRQGGIPADIAGTTSRIFLGVQIQCAQCHNHPYERWTMEDFAGMASFFNYVQPRRVDRENPRAGFTVQDPTPQQLRRRGRRGGKGADIRVAADADPKFLGSGLYEDRDGTTRRAALAEWITDRDNPYFAKAIVNRVWSWHFGRGIVSPVDDFRSDNVPSHPGILNSLALGFAESGYDLRFLVRAITYSDTYQRTSQVPTNVDASDVYAVRTLDVTYARGPVKPLTAEQVFDSLMRVTGVDDTLRRSNRQNFQRAKQQLLRQFIFVLDDDEMNESEAFAGTIPQGLMLMNGTLTQIGTRTGGARNRNDRMGALARFSALPRLLAQTSDPKTRIKRIYLTTLGREPTRDEFRRAAKFGSGGKGDQPWEDLFWALLNCSEFMSNH
ncbi:MAG: DUF1553 domain-containing protein [Planctomycetota bacterium]|jgi:hypothetical protein